MARRFQVPALALVLIPFGVAPAGTSPARKAVLAGPAPEVVRLVGQIESAGPVRLDDLPHLALYPLRPRRPREGRAAYFADPGIRTLDEALAAGEVALHELESPTVPALQVDNRGPHPVLILGGEILVGGRQNRILRADLLLPPRSGPLDVSAYCVEQGRWSDGSRAFTKAGALAPAPLRRSAAAKVEQHRVWEEIRALGDAAGEGASPTGSLQEFLEDKDLQAEASPRIERLREMLPADTIGLIVLSHGRLRSFDLFGSIALFAKYREKILRSAVIARPARDASHRWEADVSRLLDDAGQAGADRFDTAGPGSRLELSGRRLRGEALVAGGSVVHMALFLW